MGWRDFRARLVQQERRLAWPTTEGVRFGTPESLEKAAADGGDSRESAGFGDGLGGPDGWAYTTPVIEQGSVLLSSSGDRFAVSQQYFHKAVILIVEHDARGSVGLILNRPTAYSLCNLDREFGTRPEDRDWNVWFGGDCAGLNSRDVPFEGLSTWCLHTLDSLKRESNEIIEGVYSVDLSTARSLVARGVAARFDFLLVVGDCRWGPGQLQAELDQGGAWQLAAMGRNLFLGRLSEGQAALAARLADPPGRRRGPQAAAPAPPSPPAAVLRAAALGDGVAEWRRLRAALGPEFAAGGDEDDAHTDAVLRRWIDRRLIPERRQASRAPIEPVATHGFRLRAGTILRGSATEWLLGRPSELDDLDLTAIPAQYLHKAVLMLVADYDQAQQARALLVLLNGPMLSTEVSGDSAGVFWGGPERAEVEIICPPSRRYRGLVSVPPAAFKSLLNIGALELAPEADILTTLVAPRRRMWEAAGGRIDRVSEAAEAQIGDTQQRKWYRRFLGIAFDGG